MLTRACSKGDESQEPVYSTGKEPSTSAKKNGRGSTGLRCLIVARLTDVTVPSLQNVVNAESGDPAGVVGLCLADTTCE